MTPVTIVTAVTAVTSTTRHNIPTVTTVTNVTMYAIAIHIQVRSTFFAEKGLFPMKPQFCVSHQHSQ